MDSSFKLVICISSTALFDCNKSHEIWKRNGLVAYKVYQREHAGISLKPGVGFTLVQSLLELNKVVDRLLVDIVHVSRNDAESGQRIIDSINHYKLPIKQMSFTCGADVTRYLHAWKCDLFLSTEGNQVKRVLAGITSDPLEGIAAGLVYNMISEPVPVQPTIVRSSDNFTIVSNNECIPSSDSSWPKDQVRIVFDGEGVLFFEESQSIISEQYERETADIALTKGPMQSFALKLQNVRRALGERNGWRIRTFLVTASVDASAKRVFSTMKEWGLEIDETHFLSGLDKISFLRVMDPAIFFAHGNQHFQSSNERIPAAHVPQSSRTTQVTIDSIALTTSHHIR